MTILEAIEARHSVRRYTDEPVKEEALAILREKIQEVNRVGSLHVQLVTDEPKAFSGLMAYGAFSGVRTYLVMAGKRDGAWEGRGKNGGGPDGQAGESLGSSCQAGDGPGSSCQDGRCLDERIGYYGEQLVLLAQTLGLNTCWAGASYKKIPGTYELRDDEKIGCYIALGYGVTQGHAHKVKARSEVSNASDLTPAWFNKGVDAALLAPTAVNQQKFRIEYLGMTDDGVKVSAKPTFSMIGYAGMDLGIVKYHFEVAAGVENFEWV